MPLVNSDGELIQRAAGGDRSAFEDLYRRYARPVFGLALRRLGDRGRAEDAVQETFASIWRSAASYRPERGPGAPWLYAVARNAIVDRARARSDVPADIPDEPAAEAEIAQFPLLPKRRWAVAALVAAALAAIAFGGGYLLGHSHGGSSSFAVERIVPMRGSGDSQGFIKISSRDSVGNWPMELEVSGLPKQAQRQSYYELWLTRNHKPTELCG